ncbi:AAA family ATPase [Permianibacter sp. IMCC34836]|uniref:ExeA family protein n=1 Tax=Permianibacter fluminis TaxID=2738515 RepID=UPI0015519DE4|nr:AAA family ATPase [Permianibacter fluminis]NQD36422.1 AAA family ATPase [Permianibacter fluminis]
MYQGQPIYQDHYGLRETPFSIAPDPRFLYLSGRHREALAHLLYGVGVGGGFILLTGEVGTGKTTLCRCLLEQLPENVRLAYVLNPRLSPVELLQTIIDELHIAPPDAKTSLKALTDVIAERLLENHRRGLSTVLMIDEAQHLSLEAMEQVRLLTNLETNEKKLLQIILIGQPELLERLAQPELRQLAQRITARYHLLPLNLAETGAYVLHRLQVAGVQRSPFTGNALRALHYFSAGIPRLINTISERALLGGYAREKDRIDEAMLRQAAREVLGDLSYARRAAGRRAVWPWLAAGGGLLASALALALWWSPGGKQPDAARTTATEVARGNTDIVSGNDAAQNSAAPDATTVATGNEALALALLGDVAPDRRGDLAAQELLTQWQGEYEPLRDGPFCSHVEQYRLRCESGFADLALLKTYNTPASLKLLAGERGPFWVSLVGMTEQRALIRFGQREAELSLPQLQQLWSGEYQLLWQPPNGYSRPLSEGMSGPQIIWLATALASANGGTAGAASARFDNAMKLQVQQFQREHGLMPDGVAGVQTLIAVQANDERQPRLHVPALPSQNLSDAGGNAPAAQLSYSVESR